MEFYFSKTILKKEPTVRIELTAFRLRSECSTTKLCRLIDSYQTLFLQKQPTDKSEKKPKP